MFFSTGFYLIFREKKFSFLLFRKKEANISEMYESIRHLLSRDEVCLI